MVFSSLEFIFLFLPAAYGVLYLLVRFKQARASIIWLIAASLLFYGYWKPVYLWLICGSIAANYGLGHLVDPQRALSRGKRRVFLIAAIAFNLALLGYFKYLNLFADTLDALIGSDFHLQKIILPIGISFFTFQQISYQVDRYCGLVSNRSFLNYALFVVYFPQLIAGPIVHHKEMLDQFDEGRNFSMTAGNLSYGLTYFLLGLAKKTLIADPLAIHANAVFAAAEQGVNVSASDAWVGVLAYTGQIYFDFAGYSAMAIGLAAMVGIRLPVNFNSPYKSFSIQEFWRRWHITLSRFLRDYLYIPLGGNRYGEARRLMNLMLTMLIGGMWHGAAWTFVVWGGLHGLYLVINRAFDVAVANRAPALMASAPMRAMSWVLTFLAVMLAWVFFRATSFSSAHEIVAALVGAGDTAAAVSRITLSPEDWALFAIAGFFAFLAPNAAQFMSYNPTNEPISPPRLFPQWRMSGRWLLIVGAVGFFAILATQKNNEFIYFQF
ncbi:MAG: MBOAT family protein [Parvularculaceae bacterium]